MMADYNNSVDHALEDDTRFIFARDSVLARVCGHFDNLKCELCGVLLTSLQGVREHCHRSHHNLDLTFQCTKCDKGFSSYRGICCHFSKCRGARISVSEGPLSCSECERKFDSKRALSTHERHMHPGIRNAKRLKDFNPRGGGKTIHGNTKWTEEEVQLLVSLSKRFEGYKSINKEISLILTSKTCKQISDKRRYLNLHNGNGGLAAAEAVLVFCDDSHLEVTDSDGAVLSEIMDEEYYQSSLTMRSSIVHGDIGREVQGKDLVRIPPDNSVMGNCVVLLRKLATEKRSDLDLSKDKELRIDIEKATKANRESADGRVIQSVADNEIDPDTFQWKELLLGQVRGFPRVDENSELFDLDDKLTSELSSDSPVWNDNCELIVSDLCHVLCKNKYELGRQHHVRKGKRHRGIHHKREKFRECQKIFRKSPRKLAEYLYRDKDLSHISKDVSTPQGIEQYYSQLWGKPELLESNTTEEMLPSSSLFDCLPPITPEEVEGRIHKIRPSSAPGLDGVGKIHLVGKGITLVLAKLYNLLFLTGGYPECWKRNRTVFIPKIGKDLSEVGGWRPLTIGSLLARMYSAFLERRIRRVTSLSSSQRGFTNIQGCHVNLTILKEGIRQAKVKNGGVIVSVDIEKAFDTIPHSVIFSRLASQGVPPLLRKIISNMYKDVYTVIEGQCIPIKRGVKQGDPLFPLLFNIAIDPVLRSLEEFQGGLPLGNSAIKILAFDDDIILGASSAGQAQQMVDMLGIGLTSCGLGVSHRKCFGFQIVNKNKTWAIVDPMITLNGSSLPFSGPEDRLPYLGVDTNPWDRKSRYDAGQRLISAAKRGSQLSLKPQQKINLITTFLLPKFLYILIEDPPSPAYLKSIDHDLRQIYKNILHLPNCVSTAFMYSPKRDGGLGLPRLSCLVPLAHIKAGIKLGSLQDSLVREITTSDRFVRTMGSVSHSIGASWPLTLQDIYKLKSALKRREAKAWESCVSQGQGAAQFRGDSIGNNWLHNPGTFRPGQYIEALKLRANSTGVRVNLKRSGYNVPITCRFCKDIPETQAHVLGLCPKTKGMRILRHDSIVNRVRDKLKTKSPVALMHEQNFTVEEGQVFKPDIVTILGEVGYVIDVTVRYEDRDYIKDASVEKIRKYEALKGYLKDLYPQLNKVEVLPLVFGSRGAVPGSTVHNMGLLGFTKREMVHISRKVITDSLIIISNFLEVY
uniref:R2 protein n=1 Tax=Reticulitermes urbis TaxID=197766 RepID=F1AQS5_9NEOP|nr:R2 protein [Reticulitermes urbis]